MRIGLTLSFKTKCELTQRALERACSGSSIELLMHFANWSLMQRSRIRVPVH
jgi:hypothetical protein